MNDVDVHDLVARHTRIAASDLRSDATLPALGADSLSLLRVFMAIEDAFDIELSPASMQRITDTPARDLAKTVAELAT